MLLYSNTNIRKLFACVSTSGNYIEKSKMYYFYHFTFCINIYRLQQLLRYLIYRFKEAKVLIFMYGVITICENCWKVDEKIFVSKFRP